MKALTLFVLLAVSFQAMAVTPKSITCDGNNGTSITLKGDHGTHRGMMNHIYNGASIACKEFAYMQLETSGTPMKCVGLWNSAFDSHNESVDRVATITITRVEGKLVATFLNDWDSRQDQEAEELKLNCTASAGYAD